MLRRVMGLLLLSTMLLSAEENLSRGKRIWRWSLAALATANASDAASSIGKYELNPVLGNGRFGARATGLKIGISAATIGAEYLILRRHPQAMRTAAFLNFGMAGVISAVAARNASLGAPSLGGSSLGSSSPATRALMSR